jgi:transposase
MEAGMHSPWVSRFLQELGLRVIVANPRKTKAIYQNERKSDRRDAMMLARLARIEINRRQNEEATHTIRKTNY